MRRRTVLALLGTAVMAAPATGMADDAGTRPRIGFLGNSTPALEAQLVGSFRDGMRELGYVDGKTIAIEYRWAEGRYERLPKLAAELIAGKVAVIVTAGTPAALAVKKATATIPLVMVAVGDPVGTGLVASLAHPGGNATGLTSIAPELEGKRLQLLKETLPGVSRVAVFWNPNNAYQIADEKMVRQGAKMLHMDVHSVAVRAAGELDAAFKSVADYRPDAILVLADRLFLHNRERIIAFSRGNHLPVMSVYRELVDAGGLMSFGPNYAVMHRQAAGYVDRILKGAKPADLPVQQPAKFELVVSLKSAAALGLTLPQSILLRADEVLE
jgi:putative ABC transport system substrate-binding protein